MIFIEKNIPIPAKASRRSSKYPFTQMEVGDSFFIKATTDKEISRARTAGIKSGIRGARYATRAVEGGVRIWRTA